MLWLCLHFHRLPLEALALEASRPYAVTARRGSRRWIVAANRDDAALAPGADIGAAQALIPGLRVVERNPRAEREALHALAAVAYRYGQPVTCRIEESNDDFAVPFAAVWVELGASVRLFGGLAECVRRLRADLRALGHAHAVGLAPTLEGAALLARAGATAAVARDKELRPVLARLSLRHLALPAEVREAFRGAGLRTVGEVLAIPRHAHGRRFGTETLTYLDRVLGLAPDPRRPWHPPATYERRFEFDGEIESLEGLLFPLKRVLQEFAQYLRARDTGVQELELSLAHADAAPTVMLIRLVAPSRDGAHLLLLARERLERVPAAQPVVGLRLRAERFAEPQPPQFDLFDARARADGEWQALLEQLIARLGPEAVSGLGLVADHRPEKCWKKGSGTFFREQDPAPGAKNVPDPIFGARPVWLVDPPRPLAQAPAVVGAPERIEGGWWDGADAQRDYYTAETGAGARLWVFREHASGRWFLQGLWG